MGGSSVLALSSLYRYDDHHEDDGYDHEEADDHEGDQGGDQGDEEGRWQSGEEGPRQEDVVEQRPHHQAGRDAQGHLPGCEPRYAQDGLVRLQALVLRSWGAPATLTSRLALESQPQELRSCTEGLLTDPSF